MAEEGRPPARPRVLIVDDEPAVREFLGRVLSRVADVMLAVDGEDALQKLSENVHFDLVLADIVMPRLDGLQLLERMRTRGLRVPVIVVTGQGSEEIAIEALRAGATNYVRKPVSTWELHSVVQQTLAAAAREHESGRLLALVDEERRAIAIPPDLGLVASTAGYLTRALGEMKAVAPHDVVNVAIAVQEALWLAIVHGSLGLPAEIMREETSEIEKACRERLAESRFAGRRVHASALVRPGCVEFRIRHEGEGFDSVAMGALGTDDTPPPAARGRGLFLIRQFCDEVEFADGGKELILRKRASA